MLDLFEDHGQVFALLKFMERASRAGVFAYDLAAATLKFSPGMYGLLGIVERAAPPSIELLRNFVHPQDRMSLEEVRAYLESGFPQQRVVQIILHDGRTRWLSVQTECVLNQSGAVMRLLGFCIDITRQRLEHVAQEATRARFTRAVLAVAPVIWTADRNGFVTQALGWGNATGLSDSAALGMDWVDALHTDDRDPTVSTWKAACGSNTFYEREYRVATQTGEWRLYRTTGVRSPQGADEEWSGILVDVSAGRPVGCGKVATGAQIRGARGLLRWSVAELSAASGVSTSVIRRIEDCDDIPAKSETAIASLSRAINLAGVDLVFVPGELPGVRLHRQRHVR